MLLFVTSNSHAQFGNTNNPVNAIANTGVAAIHTAASVVHSINKSGSSKDTITGNCESDLGSCNGADISLFLGEREVFKMTLTSIQDFKIPNLKKLQTYQLKLSWPRHQLNWESSVETGDHVKISVKKK